MVDFTVKKSARTRTPQVIVDAGQAIGTHVFQLTVIDASGNRSKPARIKIEVTRNEVIFDPRIVNITDRVVVPITPVIPTGRTPIR